MLLSGIVISVGVEWTTVYLMHWWTYSERMPVVPGLRMGVAPLAQMLERQFKGSDTFVPSKRPLPLWGGGFGTFAIVLIYVLGMRVPHTGTLASILGRFDPDHLRVPRCEACDDRVPGRHAWRFTLMKSGAMPNAPGTWRIDEV